MSRWWNSKVLLAVAGGISGATILACLLLVAETTPLEAATSSTSPKELATERQEREVNAQLLQRLVENDTKQEKNWWNTLLSQPVTKAIGAVLLAYLVSFFGLRAYFKQRQADRARTRFVEEGIDAFAAGLDSLLSVQRNNWQMMLRYMKLIRDAEATVNPEEFFRSLREIDGKDFNIVSAQRVFNLLGEKIFWIGYQKLYSFVTTRVDFIVGDFGSALKSIAASPGNPNKQEFIDEAGRKAEEMANAERQFYIFTSVVAEISALADEKIFHRKSAMRFKNLKEVRAIVDRLKLQFPEWETDAGAMVEGR